MMARLHKASLCLLLLLLASLTGGQIVQDNIRCRGNTAIKYIQPFSGRRARFGCHFDRGGAKLCQESGRVNKYREAFFYTCPKNHYLAGMKSERVGDDKLWSFYCCKYARMEANFIDCQTEDVRGLWSVPYFRGKGDDVIIGLSSTYERRGRRWKITQCRMQLPSRPFVG